MRTDYNSYTVHPHYCIGDNTPEAYEPEELRQFLISELDEARETGQEPIDPGTTLEELFAGSGDFDRATFDVTRCGCLQSTLTVFPGDRVSDST